MMNMGNLNKMMRQVQQVQDNMKKVQDELAEKTVEATAGGGMVTAVMTGKQELKSLVIKPEAVDPEDVEMLQDLVMAAINEALRKSTELASAEMAKATGGLKMPGMPGLF